MARAIGGKAYPQWVCSLCGTMYGRRIPSGHVATWHEDTCGVCGNLASVTEPRDFGHLMDGWQKHKATNKESGNE